MKMLIMALALSFVAAPACAAPKTIQAELGKPFVLRKKQVAVIKNTDASIRITGFINSPCPKGARCVWSGQAVHLELTVAGSTVALDGNAPYSVEILSSDYKTRAKLLANKR